MSVRPVPGSRIDAGETSVEYEDVVEVARFLTIEGSDKGFTVPDSPIGLSDAHILDFEAPGLIPEAPTVLFLRTTYTGGPQIGVVLNSEVLISRTLAGDGVMSWHEIVSPRRLRETGNELVLGVGNSGQARVTFTDIVIMYKSNQTTIRRKRVIVATQ